MAYGFIVWWYGAGLTQTVRAAESVVGYLIDLFSLNLLIKTWFFPWKNDVLTAGNISLADQIKLWELNLVSRLVGAVLRTFVIFGGTLVIVLVSGLLAFGVIIWLALPLLVPSLLVIAFILIGR